MGRDDKKLKKKMDEAEKMIEVATRTDLWAGVLMGVGALLVVPGHEVGCRRVGLNG